MIRATALYWNVAEAAARLGSTTYELWAGLRSAAQAAGLPSVGVSVGAISRLRGQAGAIVRAAETFDAAEGSAPIIGAMIAPWPVGRSEPARSISPETMVRGTRTYLEGGVALSSRFTFKYGSLDGYTKDDLLALVAADAAGLADSHDQTALDIGSFEIISM
jgi:hypothetical protein